MLLLVLLLTSLCVGSSLGHCRLDNNDPCSTDDECTVTCVKKWGNCNKGRCGCYPGDNWDSVSDMCYTPSVLGGPCADNMHCVGISGGHCDVPVGVCTCDVTMRQITSRYCVDQDMPSAADLCNTTNINYFYFTAADTIVVTRFTGTAYELCGCPANHDADPQNAQKCISTLTIPTVASIEYGTQNVGDPCIKSGDDKSRQCREGLVCAACPGENLNKFTCNSINSTPQQNVVTASISPLGTTPASDSPALQTFSFILVTVTSFGIAMMM